MAWHAGRPRADTKVMDELLNQAAPPLAGAADPSRTTITDQWWWHASHLRSMQRCQRLVRAASGPGQVGWSGSSMAVNARRNLAGGVRWSEGKEVSSWWSATAAFWYSVMYPRRRRRWRPGDPRWRRRSPASRRWLPGSASASAAASRPETWSSGLGWDLRQIVFFFKH